MNSRVVALGGVGYGSLAMATNGIWWIDDVLGELPTDTIVKLFTSIEFDKEIKAPLRDTDKLFAANIILDIVKEAKMDTLLDRLTRKEPPQILDSSIDDGETVHAEMCYEEVIKMTTETVIRFVTEIKGDE